MRLVFSFALLTALSPHLFAQTPSLGGCALFPSNNVWNTRIDSLPVDPNSAAYVASANATNNKLHPDFGYGTMLTGGMPYNLVPGSQAKYPVSFYYSGDSGPYPIPSNVNIEEGSDHHAILLDYTNCELYELFNLSGSGSVWKAGSGAIWSLNSNALRPDNVNSADAAGLPILPGLVRYDEMLTGQINHALRVTIDHTRDSHIWPARSNASSLTGTQYPSMGQRFRLKASYNISSFPAHVQVILQALKTYGMILADNGTSWHLGGVGDLRWDDNEMHQLTLVTGDNFEAVNESSLIVDPNSGQASLTPTGPIGKTPPPPPVPPPSSPVPTGWVNVVSRNSGKCLDIVGGPGAVAETITAQQWVCLGPEQTNQLFQFTPVSGGYKITAQNSGLSLQVTGGASATNGAAIEQWPFEGQSFQTWTVTKHSDGYFAIKALSTGDCLDVRAISKNNGAVVQQWSCPGNGGLNQEWSFVPTS